MSFESCRELLFALKKAKKLQDLVRKKNIFLSIDRSKKTFVLHTKVFSENNYLPLPVREYVVKNYFIDSDTFLQIGKKTAEIYLVRHIPFKNHNDALRQSFLNFTELAGECIATLNDLADQDHFLAKIRIP
jgi:predicted metal-binding transcription factor (methanogenesis marker protein 9)